MKCKIATKTEQLIYVNRSHDISFLRMRQIGCKFRSIGAPIERNLQNVLEPGEIGHFESARNDQFRLIRNSQCTSMTN